MVDEQIVHWIKENLSKGYSIEQVKKIMLERYSETDVTDAILLALHPEATTRSKPIFSKKVIWSMIISLGIAVLLLFFLLSSPSPESTQNLAPELTTTSCSIDQILSSNNLIKNYAFTGNAEILVTSPANEEMMKITLSSEGKGDLENRKAFAENTISATGAGVQSAGTNDVKSVTYFIDNITYINSEGKWLKNTALTKFSELENIQGDLSKDVKIETIEAGHIRVVMDTQKSAEYMQKFFESLATQAKVPVIIDFGKALKSLDVEYWVDENCRITQSKLLAKLNLDSESMSAPPSSPEERKINSFIVKGVSSESISVSWDAGRTPPGTKYYLEYFRIPDFACGGVEAYSAALDTGTAAEEAYFAITDKSGWGQEAIMAAIKEYMKVASTFETGPIEYLQDLTTTSVTINNEDKPLPSDPSERLKPDTSYSIKVCTSETEQAVCSNEIIVKTTSTGSEQTPNILTCQEGAGEEATLLLSSTYGFSGFNSQTPIVLPSAAMKAVEVK